MLNPVIAERHEEHGRVYAVTGKGVAGTAVYGPYTFYPAGRYAARFTLAARHDEGVNVDAVCAVIDVTSAYGQVCHARREVRFAEVAAEGCSFPLPFELPSGARLEFRTAVTGVARLEIEEYCRVTNLDTAISARDDFPNAEADQNARFFREHLAVFRGLYERGGLIELQNAQVVVTIADVRFHARIADDLNFVDEVMFSNAYNVVSLQDACIIDIGMNIGLATLRLASKPYVKEVHAFEPFPDTYDRARENISLNPELAGKIATYRFGLGGADGIINVEKGAGASGSFSVLQDSGGTIAVTIKHAADALRPIMRRALAKGRQIVIKMDCEGSEFGIVEALEGAGLLRCVRTFMVEWHANVGEKTQQDLLEPLLRSGFMAFDLSPRTGNGFFYAVR